MERTPLSAGCGAPMVSALGVHVSAAGVCGCGIDFLYWFVRVGDKLVDGPLDGCCY